MTGEEDQVSTTIPLLSQTQLTRLPDRAREVVEYRKSGLSLNHVQGCPLNCAYCIRHTYGLWDQRQPRALMGDAEAVEQLVSHRYFQADLTPIQLFNRATDPFLPAVRPHTFTVLEDLDQRGLTNHVLVITRCPMKTKDVERLNALKNLKVTLLVTYSGIEDARVEPYPSTVAANSLVFMSAITPRRYRTVLYWRPLVPGLNDSPERLDRAFELHRHADATVFTGLFYRDQIAEYYWANGLPEPYEDTTRRKIVPRRLNGGCCRYSPLRPRCSARPPVPCRTSTVCRITTGTSVYGNCATSVHWPSSTAAGRPIWCRLPSRLRQVASALPEARDLAVVDITERAAIVTGLGSEQPRYYLQHAFGFQVHDVRHPHHANRHGRADIGWKDSEA